jgi:hypothetical protein
MLGAKRILAKCRQHLHPLSPASAGYQVEFRGAVVRAGGKARRLW